MAAMTLTADGLLPLPREVRDSLGLRPGDRVDLRLRGDGVVELSPEQEHPRPYEAIADLIGCVKGGPPDLSENTGACSLLKVPPNSVTDRSRRLAAVR